MFEEGYPEMYDEIVTRAMRVKDEGYLAQGYYIKQRAKLPIEVVEKAETFTYKDYSWTEHISRKWGQWLEESGDLLDQLHACGFEIKNSDKS